MSNVTAHFGWFNGKGRIVTACGSMDGTRGPTRHEMARNCLASGKDDTDCPACLRAIRAKEERDSMPKIDRSAEIMESLRPRPR